MTASVAPRGKTPVRVLLASVIVALVVAGGLWWRMTRRAPEPPPVTPNQLRTKLVDQVATEQVSDLLDKLVEEYDDVAHASTGSNLGFEYGPETYAYACAVVPKLVRVRRLIQECKGDPARTVSKMQFMLPAACSGYQQAYEAWDKQSLERMRLEVSNTDPFPERDDAFRRLLEAQVSVYLLAEFRSYNSLPVLARVFEQKPRTPVSRLFVFYSMHRLARGHPREGLSPQASAALDAYFEATSQLPSPREVSVPAWNAAVDETDFRLTIAKEDIGLSRQPQVRLHEYPGQLRRYEDPFKILGDEGGRKALAPEVFEWYGKLKAFVDCAYP
jgi:hypothetical protein